MQRIFSVTCFKCFTFIIVITFCAFKTSKVHSPDILNNQTTRKSACAQSFDLDYVEENLLTLDQQDPQLIMYSRVKYLTPPSKMPYVLESVEWSHYEDKFSKWVANFFSEKSNGIFIEAGAHEGENPSHTLMLELKLNWTGLLVECNPTLIPQLRKHHRKAWIANVCLAPKTSPGVHNFFNAHPEWSQTGRMETGRNKRTRKEKILYEVSSIPLYTLIAGLGWKEIDFFSLDVEGAELEILKTLPPGLVIIKVLTVEKYYYRSGSKLAELDDVIRKLGLHFVQVIKQSQERDRLYVHESLLNSSFKKLPN